MATRERGPAGGPSFTERVRQELALVPIDRDCDRRAELAALVHLGGSLHLTGGHGGDPLRLVLRSGAGAVARRAFTLLQDVHDVRAELRVESPSGVRTATRYVLVVGAGARRVATAVGLLDPDGRPTQLQPDAFGQRACDRVAYVRGAFLASGSCSEPGRPAHLELAVHGEDAANALARFVTSLTERAAGVSPTRGGHRVVLKSGAAIARLLASLGATDAYLRYEERLLRREVRNEATRLANADAANLRRSVEAASSQIREVAWAAEVLGWDELDEDVRQTALTRLANPSASLGEIGELLDPPVGKSTVHRRIKRLASQAQDHLARSERGVGGPNVGDRKRGSAD